MFSLKFLAVLADVYNVVLIIATLYLAWRQQRPTNWWLEFVWGLAVVYGLMGLDHATGLWPQWQLDYSTHTGFALVLVTNLCRHHVIWPWLLSLIAYCGLMNYLDYHSWADMITTSLAVILIFGSGLYWRQRLWPNPA